jgi:hypothetical protein
MVCLLKLKHGCVRPVFDSDNRESELDKIDTWNGKWCWTRKHLPRPWNYYACFRRTVELPGRPRRCVVRISASARYTLYVNAQRVHQGPARSFPNPQSFDTLDLTNLLRPGKNTLCAICHEFGVPTFQSIFRDISGFLLDGVVETDDQPIPLHTPDGWLCRQSRAWRQDTARLSVQLGFQEHYDADAESPDWMSPDYDPAESDGWINPFVLGPVGMHPWLAMEPRGVPLLADQVVPFAQVLAQFGGENARGYKVASDVYHLPLHEKHAKPKVALDNPAAMFADNADLTTVPPLPEGEYLMVVLDPEVYRTGHVMLDIAEAAGDEIIDIIYTEDLADPKTKFPHLLPDSSWCQEATADRYRCRPGAQKWEPFWYKGMRYVALVFRNIDKPLKLRHVAIRQVHAGFDAAGTFECSDERLNQIWKVARNTQLNCAFDAFVDCPWREQAQWWGDARVQGKVTAYAFGDHSLLERGIRQLAQAQAPDGALHCHPPADLPHYLPDFMLTWVGTLWDHYFQTGRTDLLKECQPALRRLFEFFATHETEQGLLAGFNDGRWWLFLDWKPLYKDDYCGVLNLMYLQALRWAAAISELLDDAPAALRYADKADRLEDAAEHYFWDDNAKIWRDGFNRQTNDPVESVSQHMNALAILLDLKPATHLQLAKEVLLKAAQSKRTKIIEGSPFFYAYILEALFEVGCRAEAIEIIRDKWGDMIDRGATTFWEMWPGDRDQFSRCHAWSASPLYHLAQRVLGVMPVDVGWKQVHIAPEPADLDFARGAVPTPLGLVRVEWEKVTEDQLAVRVELPQGMTGEFVGPLGESRTLVAGTHEFHT